MKRQEQKCLQKRSAIVCNHWGIVKISRHYSVAMGRCRVSPCFFLPFFLQLFRWTGNLRNTPNELTNMPKLVNFKNLCDILGYIGLFGDILETNLGQSFHNGKMFMSH